MTGRISKLYHQFSKNILIKGLGILPDETIQKSELKDIQYKKYLRFEEYKLPTPKKLSGELSEALEKRQSVRNYVGNKPLSCADLSTLLHYAAGTKQKESVNRFYPSGGARFPLEIYISTRANDVLPTGLYHYRVTDHLLEKLGGDERVARVNESLAYLFSKEAPTHIIITAVWERNFSKYKDFGYPLVLLEAGHLGENLQILAANLGLNTCPLAGFYLEDLAHVLNIDLNVEAPLHLVAMGQP